MPGNDPYYVTEKNKINTALLNRKGEYIGRVPRDKNTKIIFGGQISTTLTIHIRL